MNEISEYIKSPEEVKDLLVQNDSLKWQLIRSAQSYKKMKKEMKRKVNELKMALKINRIDWKEYRECY